MNQPERAHVGESFSLNRALDHALTGVRLAPWPLWLGAVLVIGTDGCLPRFPSTSWPPRQETLALQWSEWLSRLAQAQSAPLAFGAWLAGVIATAIVGVLALLALNAFFEVGFLRLHEHVLVHAKGEFAPLFGGWRRILAMLGWKLLAGVCVVSATVLAIVPGALLAFFGFMQRENRVMAYGAAGMLVFGLFTAIYVGLGVYLGELTIVFEGLSPIAALKRSFTLASGHRLRLFGFALGCLMVNLASGLGILLCCVGLIATVPLARALTAFAKTESFLLATRGPGASEAWVLWRHFAHASGLTSGPVQGWAEPPRDPPA